MTKLIETRATLLDRLSGMQALLATWQGQSKYQDTEYVSDLDKRCQCLELEVEEWLE